jgi:pyrophosphate--fructose-6-phosphate 1-phosphotransferase
MTVAILTSGGLAPGLSSTVASLVEHWMLHDPDTEVIGYRHGYAGLLAGDALWFGPEIRRQLHGLHELGGSPLGSSRVKLTNAEDLVARGILAEDIDPLSIAARQLARDGVTVLHPIGGDDTAANAIHLAHYCRSIGQELTVVGLPKTIDNDIAPIARSIGASSAAEAGARFARNVMAEHSSAPRTIVIHEVMGRDCGWLTARTAQQYLLWVEGLARIPELVEPSAWGVHAVLLPEIPFTVDALAARLEPMWMQQGSVNLFLAEGAGAAMVRGERTRAGEVVGTDAFGHPKLDQVRVGDWLADELAQLLDAERTLVVKSGYFARSGPADAEDRVLINRCCTVALRSALDGISGIVGGDAEADDALGVIDFDRIHGGRQLDPTEGWVQDLLAGVEGWNLID